MDREEFEEMTRMEGEATALPVDQRLKAISKSFWQAKRDEREAKKLYEEMKAIRLDLEAILLQLMENSGLESFRTGAATFSVLNQTRASCGKENNPEFFKFLESVGYDPVTVVGVNARSLASMVNEWKEQEVEIPGYIWHESKKKIGMRNSPKRT